MSSPESLNLYAIHEAFAQTPYGAQLAGQVRYERYKPLTVTNEEWVTLLGADVNNLTHMPLTYGLAKDFVRVMDAEDPGALSEHDKVLLCVAALTHDWGEAVIGDITYSNKTEQDEVEEQSAFSEHLAGFCVGQSGVLIELVEQAADEVVFNKETRLAGMFNAIERVGYMRTALRAAGKAQIDQLPEANTGLRWLVADVFSNHPAVLTEVAEDFPPVRQYLLAQEGRITEAFEGIKPDIFVNYGDTADSKRAAVEHGCVMWQAWLAD